MSVRFNWDKNSFEDLLKSCETNVVTPYILEYASKTGKVLEAGCGIGQFVKFLADKGYTVEGLEIQEDSVIAAKELIPDCKVIQGDVEKLPYDNDSFDTIISLGVVEHIIEGPEKALEETFRVLKPGGTVIFTIPVCNTIRKIKKVSRFYTFEYFIRKLYYKIKGVDASWLYKEGDSTSKRRDFLVWPHKGAFFEYRFTRSEISKMLKDAGFEIVREEPLEGLGGLYHEFGGALVNIAKPNFFWRGVDKMFSKVPFFHNHTYLAILKKK